MCHSCVIHDALSPEPASQYRAGVLRAGHPQTGVVYPPAELAVPVLPHRVDEIGAHGKVLAVLDAAVQQADLIVDQPVSAAGINM